jgi:DNA invertase Pin-like site-specific DNA recombinase
MNILYRRTSTIEQNSDRQAINHKDYDLLIQDKCSGTIPFFEREGGKKIMSMFCKNNIDALTVHSIDRLGRDLLDILNTIKYFTKQKINIYFKQQGINNVNST